LSTPFQNRLVGTIIVAAVVIIFLPDVLDGEKKSHQIDFEAIPKAENFSGKLTNKPFPEQRLHRPKTTPVVNDLAVDDLLDSSPEPTSEAADIKIKSDDVVIQPVEINNKPPTISKVAIVSQVSRKLPEAIANEAWVIHLGSFKNKDNVEQLLNKLKAQNYIAFTRPIKTKQGTLTKVIIGPELIKSAMVKKIPALKKLTGIQGKVAYFNVNK